MKRFLTIVLLFVWTGAAQAEAPEYSWSDTLDQAKVNRLLAQYSKIAQSEPSNFDIRLRAAQLCFYAWRLENKDNKRRLEIAKHSLKLSDEAVKLKPDHPGGYLWVGSSLGMIGLTRGILNSLQLVPQGKFNLEKSISLDKTYLDGVALALIGHAYAVVPGFPLSIGDKQKALEKLLQSRKVGPNATLTALFLADLLWAFDKNDEAVQLLESIPGMKPQTELDYFLYETNKRKAKEITALIRSGQKRDPFIDVVSDIQPGLVD